MTTRAFISTLFTATTAALAIIVLTLAGYEELLGPVLELLAALALVGFVVALACSETIR